VPGWAGCVKIDDCARPLGFVSSRWSCVSTENIQGSADLVGRQQSDNLAESQLYDSS
jgi:hypothetical protein